MCFDFCFSIQVFWFLTSRLLFLNNKNIRQEHVFVFEHGLFCFDYCVLSSSFLVSHLKMVVFRQKKNRQEHVFVFEHGLFCFDYCVLSFVFQFKFVGFSFQDGLFLNETNVKKNACFCL